MFVSTKGVPNIFFTKAPYTTNGTLPLRASLHEPLGSSRKEAEQYIVNLSHTSGTRLYMIKCGLQWFNQSLTISLLPPPGNTLCTFKS